MPISDLKERWNARNPDKPQKELDELAKQVAATKAVHDQKLTDLLAKLRDNGGAIVLAKHCCESEQAAARRRGDLVIDGSGVGYILRPRTWLDLMRERDPIYGSGRKTALTPRSDDRGWRDLCVERVREAAE